MSITHDAGGDPGLLKIAAARVIASDKMPYLSTALFAMVPVKVEGLGTLASDAKWRLYWDPAKIAEWPVEQVAGVLLHEVGHCIRGHAPRFAALQEPHSRHLVFNVAGDSLINMDLRDERIPLPEGCVYVEHIEGATREMSAEQIYRLLIEKAEQSCTCGQGGKQQNQPQPGDQSGQQGQQGQQGDQPGDDSGAGDQQGQSGQSGQQGQQPGQGGSGDQQGQPGQQPGQGGGSGQRQQRDPNCPVHGGHGNPQPGQGGIPEGWDCGAAADGIARGYEAEGDKVDAGVDEDRADLIRQQVAVEITNHSRNRGTVPAGLQRWAKDILDPVVDWRRELATIIRRTFAQVAGLRDYSYQRPSRRQSAMRGSGQNIILPAMRQPAPPQVAIVFDTSGSMSDDMLAWSLSEAQGVLRSIGASDRGVRVYACDAATDKAQRVRNVKDVKLTGGGGTDMRVGITAAMSEHPKPDVVIVFSDGWTPWPSEPIKGTTLIVGLTDQGAADKVPSWARKLTITR